MITNVKGTFNEFEGTVLTSADNFITSDIDFSLNTASINTGTADRDGHLKSADFFDVENHEKITFKGTSYDISDDKNSFVLHGDLTIKGITKNINLDVEFNGLMKDPWGNLKAGFSIEGKIIRKDWGLNWNAALETGGVLVGEEVKINCDVQLIKLS